MAFQTSVASQQSPGIEGGFYGANPHFTLTNPDEGMWVAGGNGVTIGQFAWANVANGQVSNNHPGAADVRIGFVHRDQPAVISGLLSGVSNLVVAGQGIDLLEDGPMWGRFAAGVAKTGLKIYASYATGAMRAAVTASPATATGVTWSQNNSVNVTAVAGGTLVPGQPVSGTGIPVGAYVVSVSGTTAVLSAATTGGPASGVAVTQTTDFETAWSTKSVCGNGELAKISVRG